MAKDGFKVMGSDMHVTEPPDMWERYLEPKFRDRGPRMASPLGQLGRSIQFDLNHSARLAGPR